MSEQQVLIENRGQWDAGDAMAAPSDVDAALIGLSSGAVRSASSRMWRLLVARWLVDVLAVVTGLVIYNARSGGGINSQHVVWASVLLAIAFALDVREIDRSWGFYEEIIVAARVAGIGLVITSGLSVLFASGLSRIFLVTVAVVMLFVRPIVGSLVEVWILRADKQLSVIAICSDEEFGALEAARRDDRSGRITSLQRRAVTDLRDFTLLRGLQLINPIIVVGIANIREDSVVRSLTEANELGMTVRSFPAFFEAMYQRVPIASLVPDWFLFDIAPIHRPGYRLLRRSLDLVAGTVGMALLCLLLPFMAILIKLDSRGAIFYRQVRFGRGNRPFQMWKLRTMHADAEAEGARFADRRDTRVTRVGALLRRSRLDELPQALNLLLGEMTLIGPRPERPEFASSYERDLPYYGKRLLIQPGITGWAQVNEGYSSSVEEASRKLERDLYYLKHQSIALDLRILGATLGRIFSLSGR